MELPPDIAKSLIPDATQTATNLLQWPLPILLGSVNLSNPENFFSNDEPNTVDLQSLQMIASPPKHVIDELHDSLTNYPNAKSIACLHAGINHQTTRLPLFILTYWRKLVPIRLSQRKLTNACQILEKFCQSSTTSAEAKALAYEVHNALGLLPWQTSIQGFPVEVDALYLTAFFSTEWLSSEHITWMMDLLDEDLQANGVTTTELIRETATFMAKLGQAHLDADNYTTDQGYRWIAKIGQRLASGETNQLALVANVNENHWVAILVDINTHAILYGNSLQHDKNPAKLMNALQWWLYYHFAEPFHVKPLPITAQQDGHNCGIFAWQALEAMLLQKPLISSKGAYIQRLQLFKRVMERDKDKVQ